MDPAPRPDAGPRLLGLAISFLALAAGWVLAMPFSDRLVPDEDVLGLVCLSLLAGGSLALVGFAVRLPALAWSGAGAASLMFFFARLAWPYLPAPIALLAAVAWWQARRPPLASSGALGWQEAPPPARAAPRRP